MRVPAGSISPSCRLGGQEEGQKALQQQRPEEVQNEAWRQRPFQRRRRGPRGLRLAMTSPTYNRSKQRARVCAPVPNAEKFLRAAGEPRPLPPRLQSHLVGDNTCPPPPPGLVRRGRCRPRQKLCWTTGAPVAEAAPNASIYRRDGSVSHSPCACLFVYRLSGVARDVSRVFFVVHLLVILHPKVPR